MVVSVCLMMNMNMMIMMKLTSVMVVIMMIMCCAKFSKSQNSGGIDKKKLHFDDRSA